MVRVYFVMGGLFVVVGIVETIVARRLSFLDAYPIFMGAMMVLNGFTFLRAARKTEASRNASRALHLPSFH